MSDGQEKLRPAGGYATQRGINYQNRVAAYFSACCLAERVALPVLPQSLLKSIRCETGEPLADILLDFEDEGIALVEVKRSMQLSSARLKPLVSHLVEQFLVSEQGTSEGRFPWRRPLDCARDRLLLVTSSDSPAKLTQDLAACLTRIYPEARPEDLPAIPQNVAEREAFGNFKRCCWTRGKNFLAASLNLSRSLDCSRSFALTCSMSIQVRRRNRTHKDFCDKRYSLARATAASVGRH